MGGLIIDVDENVKFQPQVFVKQVRNAPIDVDANFSFIFNSKYITGLTYRTGGNSISGVGESIDLLFAAQVSENVMFGVSYDITLSDLRDYNSGSVEVMLRYCAGKGNSQDLDYEDDRFF